MDSQFRYTLTDMEGFVRQIISGTNTTIDASGNAITTNIIQQNISNQEIDGKLNESLVALYTEAIILNDELFAIDIYQDIVENVVQYAFPLNMLMLRNMNYKRPNLQPPTQNVPPGSSPSAAQPWDYEPMVEISDPMDKGIANGYFRAPTYRRSGDNYILSRRPREGNLAGIRMSVVVLPPPLGPQPLSPVILGLFARLSQEVVIYDAAVKLAAFRKLQVSPATNDLRNQWHTRFMTAIVNAIKQQSTNIVSERLIANTYSGRRGWTTRGGRW